MSGLIADLERLAALLEKGLITRKEFEEEKQALKAARSSKADDRAGAPESDCQDSILFSVADYNHVLIHPCDSLFFVYP